MNEIENMWNSMLNEEEKLLDFDTFFIGDGSKDLMNKVRPISIKKNFQLTGIENITDLIANHEDTSAIESVNDIDQFFGQSISMNESPEDYFFNIKKFIFEHYDYLEIKAKKFGGKPIREKDLVLSLDDYYLIKAFSNDSNSSLFRSFAQISAFFEMGFTEVKFNSLEDCPLCQANNGVIYSLDYLFNLLVNSGIFLHKNCLCDFIPVVRLRSKYKGKALITKDFNYEGIKLVNAPIEYYFDILDLMPFIDSKEINKIEFTDFSNLNLENSVVVKEDQTLFVHCNYVGNYSPYDYLFKWVNDVDVNIGVDALIDQKVNDKDIYYFNGKKVVEINGKYFDISTKKEVQ